MAFQGFGFGRTSGPYRPHEFKFGNFPSSSPPPASPPFNNDNNTPPPPRFETGSGFIPSESKTPQREPSPHLAFARNDFADGLRRPHEEAQRPAIFPPQWGTTPRGGNSYFPTHQRPSPVTQGNFPTNQRPSPVAQGNFPTNQRPSPVAQGNFPTNQRPSPVAQGNFPTHRRQSPVAQGNFPTHQRQSPVAQGIASFSAGTSVLTKPANFQGSKRTRSPPSSNPLFSENLNQHVNGRDSVIPQRMQISYEDLDHPSEEDQRFPSQPSNFQAPKRTRSPPILPANKVHWRNSNPSQDDVDGAFTSHQSLDNISVLQTKNASSPSQRSSPFSPNNAEGTGAKAINSQVAKRSRSPPLSSTEEVFQRTSYSSQHDEEREMQAKAKRLARFGAELSQPMQSNLDHLKHKVPESRNDQTFEDRQKVVARQSMEVGEDVMLPDHEGLESSNIIIGLCPDMCPESEREERERKGDLDRYERFDGDRNQTSKSLAVKKYTRTAEREAILIRPMPVLQKTIDYLLALLDQPYDDRFLGMYNFLWDRMRAIRMDLRMQHLFDQDAITMLEQMIRLHIIAMHELCEYTKGEGFSEGFDAHLNIEQMNKTSVELFQLYDDHRKKGANVPSEKEFRGYYALLKLDKHPGYKVEPAELSLDLAKMTPEIRQTPEILFARDVARACRTCNFIAFFRLARKATYLQACLMHAHFAKLRTQALASLHSGLQSNQGIPLSQAAKWLGMEEDDIESLVEYHGFLIKEFEEPYMVKEGPFLNSDKDYQTKCSQLVHLKKSRSISEDVSSSGQSVWPTEESKQVNSDKKNKPDSKAIEFVKRKALVDVVGKEMFDSEQVFTPIQGSQAQSRLVVETDPQVAGFWGVASLHQPSHSPSSKVGLVGKPARETIRNDSLERDMRPSVQGAPFQFGMGGFPKTDGYTSSMESAPKADRYISSMESHLENPAVERVVTENHAVERVAVENPAAKRIVIETQDNDSDLVAHHEIEDETAMVVLAEEVDNVDDFNIQLEREIATVKLKLIIRKWRRSSLKRRELREQRQMAAKAALSSLSLGIPIRQIKSQPSHVGELDINQVVKERHERQRRSWSRLNVSEVVAEILRERNTDAKCICWKLIVCSEMKTTLGNGLLQGSQSDHLASRWLHHKLMGAIDENDDELVLSYTGLSIWKKWITSQYHSPPTCCLSVIREANFGNLEDTVGGVSAILFLLSESISWEAQKSQLHNLVMSLPSGSRVPLLILSGTYKEQIINPSLIADKLGLNFMYKTRISTFSVLTFFENHSPGHLDGFFSDDCLRQGIQWLASNSPLQPVLHCTRTRELVMDHLSSSLDMLEKVDVSEVSPDTCISVFNKALEQSEEEVSIAADANPTGWPCSEIELLEELSDEHRAVDLWLPCVGWSSAATTVPILGGIQSCKLPTFIDDLSWLNAGSEMGKEILNQKAELEKCLFRYLAQSSKILDAPLAMTEAYVMLQKGATIELQGSNYRIKPRWVSIFRRIFNWQLMNLTTGIPSVAYVLKHQRGVEPHMATLPNFGTREVNQQATLTVQDLGSVNLQSERSPACSLAQPSLDEMIEVCCNTRLSSREEFEALDAPTLSCKMVDHDKLQLELDPMQDHPRVVVANEEKKEADKLNQLLEQCNMLQDMIDVKLSIYGYDT